ncbi:hypothetical protein Asera_55510 [Actinocatenispora sera]|uniref:Uncharacterized protein n=1 Tax=Actinocatenispora sera TaxID=390989 RepID=A0A810L810_9ACTN|nr:hypothetical protein Asera_55510 [Actinocatenispora sera]
MFRVARPGVFRVARPGLFDHAGYDRLASGEFYRGRRRRPTGRGPGQTGVGWKSRRESPPASTTP